MRHFDPYLIYPMHKINIFYHLENEKRFFYTENLKSLVINSVRNGKMHHHAQLGNTITNNAVQGESNLVILTMRLNKTLYLVYPLNLLTYHNIDFLFLFTNRYFNIPLLCNNICFYLKSISIWFWKTAIIIHEKALNKFQNVILYLIWPIIDLN